MNWALKRKLLYFLAVFLVFGLVVFYIIWRVFLTVEPTCFDGKQNGEERGVDCGGICEIMCMNDVRNIVVRWAQAAPVTEDVYNVVAYLDNQNVSSGIQKLWYEFKVYNDKNILIAERRGETFIGPNQRTAILEPRIAVGNQVPVLTNFEILKQSPWQKTEDRFAKQVLLVERKELTQETTNPRLAASLRNTQSFGLRDIEVVALVYDIAGNVIASSETFVDRINQGELREVVFTWPRPLSAEATQTEIVARVNPFNQPVR